MPVRGRSAAEQSGGDPVRLVHGVGHARAAVLAPQPQQPGQRVQLQRTRQAALEFQRQGMGAGIEIRQRGADRLQAGIRQQHGARGGVHGAEGQHGTQIRRQGAEQGVERVGPVMRGLLAGAGEIHLGLEQHLLGVVDDAGARTAGAEVQPEGGAAFHGMGATATSSVDGGGPASGAASTLTSARFICAATPGSLNTARSISWHQKQA
ncbi:hypothetical protein GALL_497510 [mine drainage metagenome]|uniref:Uncharacterized protein n=1 Tax=mine drainage metagenome TaxID=410659 RepID=A0A1J5PM34_9ZZZZ